MLSLVFGVSVILYLFDVPIIPQSSQLIPTVSISLPPVVPTTPPVSNVAPSLVPTTAKKTLSASIDYDPEGRRESIQVSLVLDGTMIVEINNIHSMNDGKSRRYQRNFEAEIAPMVVGKDIKSLSISTVAGASFTTSAFMQAIETIKNKI